MTLTSLTSQTAALHCEGHGLLWLGEGLDGEIVQSLETGQAAYRKVGELAVLDAQVLQLVEVL